MTVPDKLPDDIAELKAIIRAQQDQNARLEALVASFKKALFGAKSEKIDPGQYELELEDIETAIAQVEAEVNADERTAPVRTPHQPRQTNRGSLPKHLERVEVVIEPELACTCGAERHVIGRARRGAFGSAAPHTLDHRGHFRGPRRALPLCTRPPGANLLLTAW